MRLASLVIGIATDQIIEKGKKIASHLLEASVDDIEFADGRFGIKGTDRFYGIFDIAKAAETRADLPDDLKGKLDGIGDQVVRSGAWPSGTHICEVRLLQWAGIDDVGLAINPMILHGQTHGAAAQGIGQALMELCYYDREN